MVRITSYFRQINIVFRKEVTIQAGKVSAGVASITIQPMTQEMLDSGNKYALPISIMHTDGNLLESMQNMIYLMDPVIITSVPVLTGSTPAKLNMTKDYNVTQWSVEFRVNMSILGTEVGEYNNQALFSANPSSGKLKMEKFIFVLVMPQLQVIFCRSKLKVHKSIVLLHLMQNNGIIGFCL